MAGINQIFSLAADDIAKYVKLCGKRALPQTKPVSSEQLQGLHLATDAIGDTFKLTTKKEPLKEAHSFHHYFQSVNHKIGTEMPEDVLVKFEKELAELDEEFKHLKPLEKEEKFWRATHLRLFCLGDSMNNEYNIIWNAQVGDIIQPQCFYPYTSTHGGRHVAATMAYTGNINSARAMLMEIRAPKGSRISINDEHSGEAVFPRNAKFRLISKETKEVNNPIAWVDGEAPTFPREEVVLEYIPEV